jgi:ribonuclease HI
VQVATDGSCSVNPGPGGWAWTTETTHASGCQRLTTNQEMELRAILEALRAQPGQPIVILTDSQYAIDCVTSWLPRWRRNGWRTSTRRPVKHQPTIEAIAAELDRRPVQLVKVPGHAGHPLMSAPTGSRPPRQPCGHSAVGMDGDRGRSQPAGIFKAADCPHRRGVCSPGFRTSERTGPIE